MRILGINGIRSNGKRNTDIALREMAARGFETVDTHYPITWLYQTRGRQRQLTDARQLISAYYKEGDAVIAHSRGCLVNLRMMQMGARFSTVFWFRPAMERDVVIPPMGCTQLVVVHHPADRAIWLGARLWYHDFGDAGRHGLRAGDLFDEAHDERVLNIQSPDYEQTEFWRHSDDFLPDNIGHWAGVMSEMMLPWHG